MTTASIEKVLETGLIAATAAAVTAGIVAVMDTAWINETYNPIDNRPYQKVDFMYAKPQNPQMGGGFHRDIGYMQVMLFFPQGGGRGPATAYADYLMLRFKRPTSFVDGGTTVTIGSSPYKSPGRNDGNRWAVPVIIPFFANVNEP